MTKPAAFTATYSDWKLIRTRGVVQIVFEVPVGLADQAYQVVGGMPSAGEEKWFAIAELNSAAAASTADREGPGSDHPDPAPPAPNSSSGGSGPEARAEGKSAAAPPRRRDWFGMSAAQQAGMLCGKEAFWKFCGANNKEAAAEWVRQTCGVKSRSELGSSHPAWNGIVARYLSWMRNPDWAA